jgi:MoxR-like ATPase
MLAARQVLDQACDRTVRYGSVPAMHAALPPLTSFEQEIANLAASIDFATGDSQKWKEVWSRAATELALDPDQARAIGVADPSTAESRLTSIGVIKASPALFLVFSRLDRDELLRRIRSLIPLTRHFHTVAVFEETPDWRAVHILDVSPDGVGAAAHAHFPAAGLERLDEDGQPLHGQGQQLPPSWIVLHKGGGDYENIDGVRYRYPKSIPNGTQIDSGDVVVCYRTVNSGTADAGCIFGIGRIGRRRIRSNEVPERREVYYDRYLAIDSIRLSELGDPRDNKTNAIVHAPAEWVDDVFKHVGISSVDDLPPAIHAVTLEALLAELKAMQLFVPRQTAMEAIAAVRGGKNLMLTGPPGTGKTTFGEALAAAAAKSGLADDWVLTTATADWTSTDTVGAYRLTNKNELEFRTGQILSAIDTDRWLVVDELNRADMDKAIGQIFTVLSGQAVVTPFIEDRDGVELPVAIVPAHVPAPADAHVHPVPETWRLVATMNERDRDLLFDLSEALLRRFAIIEIAPPAPELWAVLLDAKGRTDDAFLDQAVDKLAVLPSKPLGPAVVLDLVSHLREQLLLHDEVEEAVDRAAVFNEALSLYVRPHLRDLAPHQIVEAEKELEKILDGLVSTGVPAPVPPGVETQVAAPAEGTSVEASAASQVGDESAGATVGPAQE